MQKAVELKSHCEPASKVKVSNPMITRKKNPKSLVLLGNLESLKLSKRRTIPRCFHLDHQTPSPRTRGYPAKHVWEELNIAEPSEISFLSGYSEIAAFKM